MFTKIFHQVARLSQGFHIVKELTPTQQLIKYLNVLYEFLWDLQFLFFVILEHKAINPQLNHNRIQI